MGRNWFAIQRNKNREYVIILRVSNTLGLGKCGSKTKLWGIILISIQKLGMSWKIGDGVLRTEKEEIWLSPMIKALMQTQKSDKQSDNANTSTKYSNYRTIADRNKRIRNK